MKPDITVYWKQDYIQDGSFVFGNDYWTYEDGVSISKNAAHFSGKQSSTTQLKQSCNIPAGTYLITFEVQNYQSGYVWYFPSTSNKYNSNGIYAKTYTVEVISPFTITGTEDFVGDVLNISVTKIFSLPLYTENIKEIDNLRRTIEDDIFTFQSDDISMLIKNKEIDGYFNPEDFVTYNDRIYRLDITFHLESGDKLMRYFVNNDGSQRTRRAAYNYITVTGYELSTLFNDNGWYLGDITQDENENASYKFSTNGVKPINDVIALLKENTKKLIAKYKIPISINDIYFNDMSFDNSETYEGQFGDLEGKQIIDYLITGDNYAEPFRNRVFILTKEDNNSAGVYEISNGELKEIHIFDTDHGLPSGSTVGPEELAFVHQVDISDYRSIQVYRVHFKELFGTHDFRLMLLVLRFNYTTEELEFRSFSANTSMTFSPDNFDLNKIFVSNDGVFSGNGNIDNHTYIYDNSLINFNSIIGDDVEPISTIQFNIWTREDFFIIDSDASHYEQITYYYYDELVYQMYRFLRYIQHVFENHTVSNIIKELCILQDNVWYLDYDDGITVVFNDRKENVSVSGIIKEPQVIEENFIIKKISFSDINSEIFTAEKDRMIDLIYYFTGRYGLGKLSGDLELRGHTTHHLGDRISYLGTQYMVNGEEYEDSVQSRTEIKKRTYLDLFEVVNDN